jgi:peptide/nickel transport system substrate-binding protein
LTVGVISGGAAETLDPWAAFSTGDVARVISLYDQLFEFDDDLNVHPALAESGEASADKKTWTIRLRHGVTFHDGSSLTADDVIHNVRTWVDPSALFNQQVGHQIDPKRVRKVDSGTVEIGLHFANARFDRDLANFWGSIKSRNEKRGGTPIGTGPFRFDSFTAGSKSEFAAFDDHWRPEPVHLERLVVDSSFTDENARTNALRAGLVDVLPAISYGLARTVGGKARLLRAKSGQFQNFYMRLDTAPFDHVNVRKALRLLVDRQALVDVVYGGFGSVSNDVPGRYTQFYDESLIRERDVDQAKFLLKQAGKEGLTLNLRTSNYIEGLVQAATLLKEQAKEAGVNVNVEQVDPATYFDPTTNYGKMPFAQTYYYPVPSLEFVWTSSLASRGPSNETHWYASPSYERTQSLLAEARGTDETSKLSEIWQELQKQQFDAGGYINWGTADYVDAVSTRVQGLTPSKYLNASGFNFRKAWLAG